MHIWDSAFLLNESRIFISCRVLQGIEVEAIIKHRACIKTVPSFNISAFIVKQITSHFPSYLYYNT